MTLNSLTCPSHPCSVVKALDLHSVAEGFINSALTTNQLDLLLLLLTCIFSVVLLIYGSALSAFSTFRFSLLLKLFIIGFHILSRSPCWCPQRKKWRPCWCPDPILRELNSMIMQTLSFVFTEKHGCWSRECKTRIGTLEFTTGRIVSQNNACNELSFFVCKSWALQKGQTERKSITTERKVSMKWK